MAEEKVKKHFFKDMKKELKKVIWPTKKQTLKNTFAVIFIIILISIIVIALDEVFITANNFVVDKVTGGKVSEVKDLSNEIERLNELYKQGLIDEQTFQTLSAYASFGMYDAETLKTTIDGILNPSEKTDATIDNTTNTIEQ